MPREPRVILVSPEDFERQKAEVAARCQRFLVTGNSKIVDSIDRNGPSRVKGEYVWLDPETIVIKLLTAHGLVKAATLEDEPAKAVPLTPGLATPRAEAGKDA